MPKIELKQLNYAEYGECAHITNGKAELVVTLEKGPRVIRFGIIGEENEFCEGSPTVIPVGEGTWRMLGGHRLWHSPESMPRTYSPDNTPLRYDFFDNGVKVMQDVEPWVQIAKEMEITLAACCNKVTVKHRLTNKNAWPIKLSAWALTVMAPGGREVVPRPQKNTGLLGNTVLALWPYTRMNDPRITWGDKYIMLDQDPGTARPIKFGINNEFGWAAYFNHGNLFIKRHMHDENAKYPDFGVSYETYSNDFMLEMESLSPLVTLEPDEDVMHIEEWELIQGVKSPSSDEAEIDLIVKKYIQTY